MTSGFGGQGHVSAETRALSSISETPGLDQSSGEEQFVQMLQTHDYQIKFIAEQMKQAQQGINEATQNPIQQIQQFVADIIVLLGGGELVQGALDFGDLQYILPALGALFGFGDGPFPLSLFEAAQKFFFGYVVPQQQFVDVINHITEGWLGVFGIDPEFIADLKALNQAVGDLFGGIGNLLPSLNELFGALNIDAGGLGPLGQALGPIIRLFSQFDLAKFGDIIEFITDAISPFIEQLTAVINWVNGIVAVLGFGGDVVNSPLTALLRPFQNLIKFLGDIDFGILDFNPIAAAGTFIQSVLEPTGLLASIAAVASMIGDAIQDIIGGLTNGNILVNAANLIGSLASKLLPPINIGQLTNAPTNLVADPGFDLPPAGSAEDGTWFWDDTAGRTGAGCAGIHADGEYHDLIGQPIAVAQGQTFKPSVWVQWETVVSSGEPVQLVINEFLNQEHVGVHVVDSVAPVGLPNWDDELSGSYTVPAGVDQIAMTLVVTEGATAGTVWFDDTSNSATGNILQEWVQNLVGDLTSMFNWVGSLVDNLLSAFGVPPLGGLLDKIFDLADEMEDLFGTAHGALNEIGELITGLWNNPGGLVGGIRDLAQIGDILAGLVVTPINQTVAHVQEWVNGLGDAVQDGIENFQDLMDNLWRGLTGAFGGGRSPADVANAAANTSTQADTAVQIGEWNNAVMGLRNNKSLMSGIDETEEANFPLDSMYISGAEPLAVIPATSASQPMAFWRAGEEAKKGFISWLGKGFSDVTALYIDIYRFNYTDNELQLIHTSPNQVGAVTSSWSYLVYNIADIEDRVDVVSSDVLAVAWRVVGSGTHSVAGKPVPIPAHPTVVPARPAAARTGGGTTDLSFSSLASLYAAEVPWFGIGIVEGDVPPPYFAPRTKAVTEAGLFVYDVPPWATVVEGVYVPGGGGAAGGNPIAGGFGEGGEAGEWVGEKLVRGVDFPDVPNAQITVTVGAGGTAGGWGGGGGTGGNTVRHAISGGKAQVMATGGAAGNNNFIGYDQALAVGESPGNFEWNGTTYVGGSGGRVRPAGNGSAGSAPGAGGGGGSGGTWAVAWAGGAGARGGAWFEAHQ